MARDGIAGDDGSAVERPAAAPWTVRQLTQRIGDSLAALGRVSVEGEVSRVSRAASGHLYFDLKDLDAKLACKLWRSSVESALRFELGEGQQVIVHGKLDVYAPQGSYSLIVQRIERAGIGQLLAQLEQRKAELRARGWFDRKRPLPALPRVIGVATSRDTAAFQDFLRTRSLRWPLYPVRIAHTPVQGAGAAAQIARAIDALDASGVDVIVVCRGGGSLEDLWAFNELAVAEAIWRSRAPVVSGVGHEVDFTLADFVADLRAHTPTDAAQRVIPDKRALLDALERGRDHLEQALEHAFTRRETALANLARSRVLRGVAWILDERCERATRVHRDLARAVRRLAELADTRLAHAGRALERASPAQQLARRATRFEVATARLHAAARAQFVRAEAACDARASQLNALSPLAVLERGYSITRAAGGGAPITDAANLSVNRELETIFHRGRATSRVVAIDPAGTRG